MLWKDPSCDAMDSEGHVSTNPDASMETPESESERVHPTDRWRLNSPERSSARSYNDNSKTVDRPPMHGTT